MRTTFSAFLITALLALGLSASALAEKTKLGDKSTLSFKAKIGKREISVKATGLDRKGVANIAGSVSRALKAPKHRQKKTVRYKPGDPSSTSTVLVSESGTSVLNPT